MYPQLDKISQQFADDLSPADAIALHIGSLADATLEPLTAAPHSDGSHVTLDARNVDHWSRNHGR